MGHCFVVLGNYNGPEKKGTREKNNTLELQSKKKSNCTDLIFSKEHFFFLVFINSSALTKGDGLV